MPPLDFIALWILTIANALGLLLVIRQLAGLPQFSRRMGPKRGEPVGDWEMQTITGETLRSRDAAPAYTLLFVSATCGPCHELFAELRGVGRTPGPLYVIADGDATVVADEARSPAGLLYDRLLLGTRQDPLFVRLSIPGTPFAVAVRDDRVVRAGVAARAKDLAEFVRSVGSGQVTSSPA